MLLRSTLGKCFIKIRCLVIHLKLIWLFLAPLNYNFTSLLRWGEVGNFRIIKINEAASFVENNTTVSTVLLDYRSYLHLDLVVLSFLSMYFHVSYYKLMFAFYFSLFIIVFYLTFNFYDRLFLFLNSFYILFMYFAFCRSILWFLFLIFLFHSLIVWFDGCIWPYYVLWKFIYIWIVCYSAVFLIFLSVFRYWIVFLLLECLLLYLCLSIRLYWVTS